MSTQYIERWAPVAVGTYCHHYQRQQQCLNLEKHSSDNQVSLTATSEATKRQRKMWDCWYMSDLTVITKSSSCVLNTSDLLRLGVFSYYPLLEPGALYVERYSVLCLWLVQAPVPVLILMCCVYCPGRLWLNEFRLRDWNSSWMWNESQNLTLFLQFRLDFSRLMKLLKSIK